MSCYCGSGSGSDFGLDLGSDLGLGIGYRYRFWSRLRSLVIDIDFGVAVAIGSVDPPPDLITAAPKAYMFTSRSWGMKTVTRKIKKWYKPREKKGKKGDSEFLLSLIRLFVWHDWLWGHPLRKTKVKIRKRVGKKNKKEVSHQFVRCQPSLARPPKPNAANPVLCCCCLYQKRADLQM